LKSEISQHPVKEVRRECMLHIFSPPFVKQNSSSIKLAIEQHAQMQKVLFSTYFKKKHQKKICKTILVLCLVVLALIGINNKCLFKGPFVEN